MNGLVLDSRFSGSTKGDSMKSQLYENPINGEQWVCDDIRQTKFIDGVGYISVHKPNQFRTVLMRRDSLRPVKQNLRSSMV